MRKARRVVICGIALIAALAPATAAHAATPSAPFTVLTLAVTSATSPSTPNLIEENPMAYLDAGGITLYDQADGGVTLNPPTSAPFAAGTTYTLQDEISDATHAGFLWNTNSCGLGSGTLTVEQATYDDTDNLTAFAGTYSFTCGTRVTAGEMRYNSNVGYVAETQTGSLDFGTHDLDQFPALGLTITAAGSEPLVLGKLSLTGINPALVAVTDPCSNTTIQPGNTCAISVTLT